jgi:hypothetical protein
MPASLTNLGAQPQQLSPTNGSISKTVQQNMNKQADQQSTLVNAVGGKRRNSQRYKKGGATAEAPPLRVGYNDPSGSTQNNANAINKLAVDSQQSAVFDTATSQAQTQQLAAQQQQALSGGRTRRRNVSRKNKKNKKSNKSKKNTKSMKSRRYKQ